jgi:hypothetical protein
MRGAERGGVRVLLCQCYTAQDGRALLPDQCCDLRDEEAAKLIAAGAAVAEADAPFLRLHQDWQISGTLRRTGWSGAVSPATAERALREGVGQVIEGLSLFWRLVYEMTSCAEIVCHMLGLGTMRGAPASIAGVAAKWRRRQRRPPLLRNAPLDRVATPVFEVGRQITGKPLKSKDTRRMIQNLTGADRELAQQVVSNVDPSLKHPPHRPRGGVRKSGHRESGQ